jgi:hypothetical protein
MEKEPWEPWFACHQAPSVTTGSGLRLLEQGPRMSQPLPLTDASKRLRRHAGRPRKRRLGPSAVADRASAPRAAPLPARPSGPGVAEVWPIGPRLLGVKASARYLGGISPWTIRTYIAEGLLTPVKLPGSKDKADDLRRVLLDRLELDRLVDTSRSRA